MASGNLTRLASTVQSARNTQPTTPTFVTLRDAKITGQPTRTVLRSNAMRADLERLAPRQGRNSASYTIPMELAYGAYDHFMEYLMRSTFSTDVLKGGTTSSLVMLETYNSEIGGSDGAFCRRLDCECSGWDLNFAEDKVIEGSFTFESGNGVAYADVAIASSTYGDPATTLPMCCYDGAITIDAAPVAVATDIKLSIKSPVGPYYALTNRVGIGSNKQARDITGTISVYWTSDVMAVAALAETPFALVVTTTDVAGNSYEFSLPNCYYTGGWGIEVPGPDPIVQPFTFEAAYDDTAESALVITRADAPA